MFWSKNKKNRYATNESGVIRGYTLHGYVLLMLCFVCVISEK